MKFDKNYFEELSLKRIMLGKVKSDKKLRNPFYKKKNHSAKKSSLTKIILKDQGLQKTVLQKIKSHW